MTSRELDEQIFATLRHYGHQACLAGRCARDLGLGASLRIATLASSRALTAFGSFSRTVSPQARNWESFW